MPAFLRWSLLFLLVACGNEPVIEPPAPETAPPVTYLALGDSYTIGEGVQETDRWPMQFRQRLNNDSINCQEPRILARTGWTTADLLAAIDRTTDFDSTYDLVSLLIGVNNQFQRLPMEQYRRELPQLLDICLAKSGQQPDRVFMLSIPDYGVTPFGQGRDQLTIARELDAYNAFADSLCQSLGITFFDITEQSRAAGADPEFLARDRLHPSGKMYAAWVDIFYAGIRGRL